MYEDREMTECDVVRFFFFLKITHSGGSVENVLGVQSDHGQLEGYCGHHVRDDGNLEHGGDRRNGKKWTHSKYNLEIKLTGLDIRMRKKRYHEGHLGSGLGSGQMVTPFNGTGYSGKGASFGGKTEGPAASEMPARPPSGHVKLTAG